MSLEQRRLVLLGRHEEDGGPGPLDRDGLLGHAADVAHVARGSMVPVAATMRLAGQAARPRACR